MPHSCHAFVVVARVGYLEILCATLVHPIEGHSPRKPTPISPSRFVKQPVVPSTGELHGQRYHPHPQRPTAMAVALIVGAIRTASEITSGPAAILAILNRRLHGRMQGGFATCVALRLDPDACCTLTSAGHPAPYLNGREAAVPGALPLGIAPEASYGETHVRLQPGDCLALCTDGLLEARNPPASSSALTACARSSPPTPPPPRPLQPP